MEDEKIEALPDHWDKGCSNAGRWVYCPGSLEYEQGDDDPGLMAKVGTLGHKISEQMLLGQLVKLDEDDLAVIDELDNDQRAWFRKAIKMCVDYVNETFAKVKAEHPKATIQFEKKIKSELVDDHGGTTDVTILTDELLHVLDFKFGAEAVEAERNVQVMSYINLAREANPGRKKFIGTIIQPSYRGALTYEYTEAELDEFRERMIAATKSSEKNAGLSQCKWCPGRGECTEAAKMVIRAADEFGPLVEFANEFTGTPEQVERLERIVMMHRFANNAFDKASALLKDWHNRGAKLKHHRVSSTNRRSWIKSAFGQLSDQLSEEEISQAYELSLISPPKLQKLLEMKKKEFDERFAPLLNLSSSPQLRQGSKPSPHELAHDLPIFEGKASDD